MTENFKNLKEFWKKEIEDKKKYYKYQDEWFSISDWADKIDQGKNFEEIDKIGWQLRKEVPTKSTLSALYTGTLEPSSQYKYAEAVKRDIEEIQKQLTGLETDKDTYKNLTQNYELGLKGIIGNDLTNWEIKTTKKGINDKDITDLQNQLNSLTTEKNNLEKEVKKKQDQILNHKCDTPNNNELNQLKKDLEKANQEKDRLQTEPGQKDPNIPQTPQQKEEEDKKEELENEKLTVEELRSKLNSKQQEIRNLRTELAKERQKNSQSSQNNNQGYSKFFSGMAVSFLIATVIGGMVYVVQKKKKNSKLFIK